MASTVGKRHDYSGKALELSGIRLEVLGGILVPPLNIRWLNESKLSLRMMVSVPKGWRDLFQSSDDYLLLTPKVTLPRYNGTLDRTSHKFFFPAQLLDLPTTPWLPHLSPELAVKVLSPMATVAMVKQHLLQTLKWKRLTRWLQGLRDKMPIATHTNPLEISWAMSPISRSSKVLCEKESNSPMPSSIQPRRLKSRKLWIIWASTMWVVDYHSQSV